MYLAIEGVIGVGKTSLARLLLREFEAEILLEAFEENPFLSDFYEDRDRYAFQTQIFFLLSRYRQQRETVPAKIDDGHLISDYSFEKDRLFAQLNLSGDELATYELVYAALAERIPEPDLIVYLQVETEVAMQRIALRDRPYERQIEQAYIDELNQAYERGFGNPEREEVLPIDTTHLDFVANREHLEYIANRIRDALGIPPYQPQLPIQEDVGG